MLPIRSKPFGLLVAASHQHLTPATLGSKIVGDVWNSDLPTTFGSKIAGDVRTSDFRQLTRLAVGI